MSGATSTTEVRPPRVRRNIAANLAGRAWNVVAVYLFVPLYLRYLGIEAYGVVGFYAVLQGVLAFADAGLTATLSREAARLAALPEGTRELRDVIRTTELLYWAVAAVVAGGVALGAGWIGAHWLQAHVLSATEIARAVRWMGAAVSLQLLAGLYQGGLQGLQRQVLANGLQIGWSVLRSGGGLAALALVSPSLDAFFAVQLAANALYVVASRTALLRAVPAGDGGRFEREVLRRVYAYAAGMMGLAVLSATLIQADKLAVSKLLSLTALGYYTIATSLSQVPLLFAWPVASALFPALTSGVARGDDASVRTLYHRANQLVAVVTVPAGLCIAAFARELTLAWTGSAVTAAEVAPVAAPLALGSIFLALQVVPYNLALAHAWTRLNLLLSSLSVLLIVPLLVVLVQRYGALGGGIAWLVLNVASTGPFVFFLHRRLLPGATRAWWLRDLARPALPAVGCVALGAAMAAHWAPAPDARLALLLWPTLTGTAAVLAAAAATPATRPALQAVAAALAGALRAASGRRPVTPV